MVHDVKTYTNVIAHKLLQKETIAINCYNKKQEENWKEMLGFIKRLPTSCKEFRCQKSRPYDM